MDRIFMKNFKKMFLFAFLFCAFEGFAKCAESGPENGSAVEGTFNEILESGLGRNITGYEWAAQSCDDELDSGNPDEEGFSAGRPVVAGVHSMDAVPDEACAGCGVSGYPCDCHYFNPFPETYADQYAGWYTAGAFVPWCGQPFFPPPHLAYPSYYPVSYYPVPAELLYSPAPNTAAPVVPEYRCQDVPKNSTGRWEMPRLLCHNICLSGPFSGKDMKEVDDYFCRNVPHLLGSQSCSLDVFLGVIVSSFDRVLHALSFSCRSRAVEFILFELGANNRKYKQQLNLQASTPFYRAVAGFIYCLKNKKNPMIVDCVGIITSLLSQNTVDTVCLVDPVFAVLQCFVWKDEMNDMATTREMSEKILCELLEHSSSLSVETVDAIKFELSCLRKI
jgi:hypothetical protein